MGMMALHEALRNVCHNSDWAYSVFWTIRPRPYISRLSLFAWFSSQDQLSDSFFSVAQVVLAMNRRSRGGNVCKVGADDNGSL